MKRRPKPQSARCLAGVLLWALAAAPVWADDAPEAVTSTASAEVTPVPEASPGVAAAAATSATVAVNPAAVEPLSGPLSVTLGAVALLNLGEGWRWVPQEQLKSFLATAGRRPGAWDLGIALSPGDAPQQLRLQYEPMGRVEDGPADALSADALMARLTDRAAQENARRRQSGLSDIDLNGWALTPALELDGQRLLWAEHRLSGYEERLGWHGRFRLRGGVLKLDLTMPGDQWDLLGPQVRTLFEGLQALPGQALAEAQAGDKKAPLDLPGLVVDGVFGRGALAAGPPMTDDLSLGWELGLWIAAVLALVAGALWAWRGLQAWRVEKIKERLDEARLAQLEKDLGGNAQDVEELAEDDETPPE